jgi:DNA-binding PadR family transcriptional regulator
MNNTLFMSIVKRNVTPEWFLPLTAVEFEILLSLSAEDRHGYAIMREVEDRSEGTVSLRPGSLYRAVNRLLENGLVEELDEAPDADLDDQRRRYYRLTSLGSKVATLEAKRLARQVSVARARKLIRGEG